MKTFRLFAGIVAAALTTALPAGAEGAGVANCVTRFESTTVDPQPLPQPLADAGYTFVARTFSDVDAGPGGSWAVGSYQVERTYIDSSGATRHQVDKHPAAAQWDTAQDRWLPSDVPAVAGGAFHDVAALSPTDVWAVGERRGRDATEGGQAPLLMHWDGSSWTETGVLLRGGVVRAVSAVAPDDVWAVGWTNAAPEIPAVLHWDGLTWRHVLGAEALFSPLELAGLVDIAVVAVDNHVEVYAVGSRYDRALGRGRTLVVHFDGAEWSIVDTPEAPAGTALTWANLAAVSIRSANDIWAVGSWQTGTFPANTIQPLVLRFDGQSWTVRSLSANERAGAGSVDTGSSATWVVGSQGADKRTLSEGLFARATDTSWRIEDGPGAFKSVAIAGRRSGWAVALPRMEIDARLYRVTTCG